MPAAKTIIKKLGNRPAREKAIGSVKTPPPQTVAIKLKMAMAGEERRDSQSWAGTKSSRDGRRLRRSRSLGQKDDRRLMALNAAKARVANSGVEGIRPAWGDCLEGGIRCSRLGIVAMTSSSWCCVFIVAVGNLNVDTGVVLCANPPRLPTTAVLCTSTHLASSENAANSEIFETTTRSRLECDSSRYNAIAQGL